MKYEPSDQNLVFVESNFGHILSEDPVNWILHLSVEKSSSADPYLLSDKKWP